MYIIDLIIKTNKFIFLKKQTNTYINLKMYNFTFSKHLLNKLKLKLIIICIHIMLKLTKKKYKRFTHVIYKI